MINIGYTTEIVKPYCEGLSACKSLDDIKAFLKDWAEIVPDALERVNSPDFNWKEYRRGLKLENRNKYAGDEWAEKYGVVVLPEILMYLGLKALELKVPEGALFLRMQDLKIIKKNRKGNFYLTILKKKKKI